MDVFIISLFKTAPQYLFVFLHYLVRSICSFKTAKLITVIIVCFLGFRNNVCFVSSGGRFIVPLSQTVFRFTFIFALFKSGTCFSYQLNLYLLIGVVLINNWGQVIVEMLRYYFVLAKLGLFEVFLELFIFLSLRSSYMVSFSVLDYILMHHI